MVDDRLIQGKKPTTPLERVMQKNPQTVKPYLSVTTVGHSMQGNGLSILPVVDDDWQLVGVVTRQNVFASLAELTRTSGEDATIAEQVAAELTPETTVEEGVAGFALHATPMMTNALGTVSFGVLSEAVNASVTGFLRQHGRRNVLLGHLDLATFRPIQVDSTVNITVRALSMTGHEAVLDVDLATDGLRVAKAVVTCQLLERN